MKTLSELKENFSNVQQREFKKTAKKVKKLQSLSGLWTKDVNESLQTYLDFLEGRVSTVSTFDVKKAKELVDMTR